MFRSIIVTVLALFIAGCGSSTSLNFAPSKENTAFKAANCQGNLPLRYLNTSHEYGRIDIKRDFYQNGEKIFVYENGKLDTNFRFSVSLDSLVYFVFELKNAKKVSLGNFYTYFEGISRIGKPIYIIAAGIRPFESFDLFYSDEGDIIKELVLCIKDGKDIKMANIDSDITVSNIKSYIRTDFTPALFLKYDIVMSNGQNDRYLR